MSSNWSVKDTVCKWDTHTAQLFELSQYNRIMWDIAGQHLLGSWYMVVLQCLCTTLTTSPRSKFHWSLCPSGTAGTTVNDTSSSTVTLTSLILDSYTQGCIPHSLLDRRVILHFTNKDSFQTHIHEDLLNWFSIGAVSGDTISTIAPTAYWFSATCWQADEHISFCYELLCRYQLFFFRIRVRQSQGSFLNNYFHVTCLYLLSQFRIILCWRICTSVLSALILA